MKQALVTAVVTIVALPLLIAVAELPRFGDPFAPGHTHVSPRYLEMGPEEAGSKNIVAGVLLNYRAYDTAGEVTVIFTGFAAALAVLIARSRSRAVAAEQSPVSPVTLFIARLLAPFVVLFAIYVIAEFNVAPGGGFQGGAILGAVLITLIIVLGEERIMPLLQNPVLPWLHGIGLLSFAVIGALGVVLAGYFLGFPQSPDLELVRKAMLTVLEIAIGVAGAAIFATLFLRMESD